MSSAHGGRNSDSVLDILLNHPQNKQENIKEAALLSVQVGCNKEVW